MEKRGKLVVIEGSHGSGKTTQINLLLERLKEKGVDYEVFDFPDYTSPTGKIIRRYLSGEFGEADSIDPKIASLLYANDRFSEKHKIEKALSEGKFIILDRYVESSMGHQGGKIKSVVERGEFFKWLEELEYGNFALPRPDAVFFFYMPHQIAKELKRRRDEQEGVDVEKRKDGHEDNEEHLENALQSYLHLSDFYGWKRINCFEEGLKKPEVIFEEFWEQIKGILEN